MTKEALKALCKEKKQYATPCCNDKLYAHYKGFRRIMNLEEYTALRVCWFEGNGLQKIEGLEHQKELRTLYLQENLIEKIENVMHLSDLDSLNLSQNCIRVVEGLWDTAAGAGLAKLQNLHLKNNHLKKAADLEHVVHLPALTTLDVQHNKIEDPGVLDVFARMPNLRVLYLQGNDVVKKIRHYRKTVTHRCKQLKYLDDRPVFPEDRLRVEAWGRVVDAGGTDKEALEAERAEVERQKKEKRERELGNSKAFDAMVRRAHEKAALQRANAGQHGPLVDEALAMNIFSGEAIVPTIEGARTKRAREQRWARIIKDEDGASDPVVGDDDMDDIPEETEEEKRLYELCRTVGNPNAARDAQREVEADYRQQHPQGSKPEGALQDQGAKPATSVAAAPPPPPPGSAPAPVHVPVPNAAADTGVEVDVGVLSAVKASEQDFTNMDELD